MSKDTQAFINSLKTLVLELKPPQETVAEDISDEEKKYLCDQLLAIETACSAFDISAAKDTLAYIKQKAWPQNVSKNLDIIAEHLLHSALKKVSSVVEETISSLNIKD
jgi:hypothetical protein